MTRHYGPQTWDSTVFHSNSRYAADAACEHCDLIGRHLPWCIAVNLSVFYAYEIVLHPDKITVGDAERLHALGVAWVPVCKCLPVAGTPLRASRRTR
jgi:hypothetical protein